MKVISVLSFVGVLISSAECSFPAPASSWTPPPRKFSSYEWTTNSPSWANTEIDRGGTVVWFYKEMSQEEALPVLLRALDYGETWLQTKAVQQLEKLTIALPKDFEDKVVSFYESISLEKFPADLTKLSEIERDRLSLKVELLVLLMGKVDPAKGRYMAEKLAKEASQDYVRSYAELCLKLFKGDGQTR